MATYYFKAGKTEAEDFLLRDDGAALDGTGLTVGLEVTDREGQPVPLTGSVAWLVQGSGTVRYSPAATDLSVRGSPYTARWTLTDGTGLVGHAPNGADPDRWIVVDP